MELPYQTYERITGKKWTGGQSPEVQSLYKQYDITAPAASAEANLALQKALLGQPASTSIQQEKPTSAPYAPPTADTKLATGQDDELNKQLASFVNKSDNISSVNLLDNLPKSDIDLNKIYNDAFKSAGLDNLKIQFNNLQTKINERRKQLNEAIGTVNENPWYSEASRVGHARRLQELTQPDIDNLINQQKNVKNLFDEGVTQAKDLVNRTKQQYELNQKERKQILSKMNAKKVERIGSPDTGVWEKDMITGLWKEVVKARKPVNEMTATEKLLAAKNSAIAKASPSLEKSVGADGYVDPNIYMNLRTQFAGTIGDASLFDEAFAPRLNPQERARLGVGKYEKIDLKTTGKLWTPEVEQNFVNLGVSQNLIELAKSTGVTPQDLMK